MKSLFAVLAIVSTSSVVAAPIKIQRIWADDYNGDFKSNHYRPADPDGTYIIICPCAPESEATGCDSKPNSGLVYEFDAVDEAQYQGLFNHSDDQIALGNSSGIYSTSVQVVGESFTRHYQITWSLNNGEYTQDCSRTDVVIAVP